MIGTVIGAIIGRGIDRSDGKGGLKGAALGALAPGLIKRMGPLGLALGGLYMLKRSLDRRRTRA
ncbi:MAG: hypothetical protein ACKVOP_04610 [Sphingomonadaceae bacterium]